jgi:type IV pilus assembly protein PilV
VSLVESLVALVVLSVGLLGVASLLLAGVRSNRTALYRTQAVNLVSDMTDRIRANANAGDAYDNDTYGGAPATQGCAPTAAVAGANCTIEELAQDDLARWIASARLLLPDFPSSPVVAEVNYIAAPAPTQPETYQVSIAWQEPGEDQPFNLRTDLVLMARPAL